MQKYAPIDDQFLDQRALPSILLLSTLLHRVRCKSFGIQIYVDLMKNTAVLRTCACISGEFNLKTNSPELLFPPAPLTGGANFCNHFFYGDAFIHIKRGLKSKLNNNNICNSFAYSSANGIALSNTGNATENTYQY